MLHTSEKLGMDEAKVAVIDLLTPRVNELSSEKLLLLANHHSVPAWVTPAYSAFISRPHEPISFETANTIGLRAFYHLSTTCQTVVKLRNEIAINVPYYSDVHCKNYTACTEAWKNIWHSRLTVLLVHSEDPLVGDAALEKIRKVTCVPGMCDGCLVDTKDYIIRLNPWKAEKAVVESGLTELWRALGMVSDTNNHNHE
jgi:hypothetical protein